MCKRNLLIILIVIFVSLNINAQNIEFKGKIVNKNSNVEIPYSTVSIESLGIGTISDINGEYTLVIPETHQNDTIIVSALGFDRLATTILDFQKHYSEMVKLTEKLYELDEVIISPDNSEIVNIGFQGKKSKGPLVSNIFGANIGLHIENNTDKTGIVKKVRFFILDEGKPNAPFRVRIYSVDPDNKQPGLDLLTENVIISGPIKGGWVEADLSKYNIAFPKEGVFVMAEWIYSGDEFYYTKQMTMKSKESGKYEKIKRTFYGPSFGCTKSKPYKKLTWGLRSVGYSWMPYNQKKKDKYYNVMVNADIEFSM